MESQSSQSCTHRETKRSLPTPDSEKQKNCILKISLASSVVGLNSKAQEMQQDNKERAQDPADAADQDDQPAITDLQAGYMVGKNENQESHYCIYDKILDEISVSGMRRRYDYDQ